DGDRRCPCDKARLAAKRAKVLQHKGQALLRGVLSQGFDLVWHDAMRGRQAAPNGEERRTLEMGLQLGDRVGVWPLGSRQHVDPIGVSAIRHFVPTLAGQGVRIVSLTTSNRSKGELSSGP